MHFGLSDEQRELQRTTRRFLARVAPPRASRDAAALPLGYDDALWRRAAAELGWPATAIAERHGGLACGAVELVILVEETGRAVAATPLLPIAVAAEVIQRGGSTPAARWLPRVAAGAVVAFAIADDGGGWCAEGINTAAHRDGDALVLRGTKRHVACGAGAAALVVAARIDGAPVLAVIEPGAAGVTVRRTGAMDTTRPRAEVVLEDVRVGPDAIIAQGVKAQEVLAGAVAVARTLVAAETLGAAEAAMDLAVEYAKTRVQFGRPIGAFQAVKHTCADMLMWVETARSAVYHAAWALAADDASAGDAARVAAAYCGEAGFAVGAAAIQVHGGVGFTWEHDAHLYFKRLRANEGWLGRPASARAEIADALFGPPEAAWT